MSSFELRTPAANAKNIRALTQSLTELQEPSSLKRFNSVITFCESSKSLSTLSKDTAAAFFPALLSALSLVHPYARTAALRATILTAKQTPPSVIADTWASLATRVISILKSANGINFTLTAQSLVTLSVLIAAGAPLAFKGGDHKVSISTACHSAATRATRILEDENHTPSVLLAVIALLLSILDAAPREIRQRLPRLETVLWEKFLDHPIQRVRTAAARLLAYLLVCCPDKVRQNVFNERIRRSCEQLDQILDVLDFFTPGEQSRKRLEGLMRASPSEASEGVRSFSAEQLIRRYSTVSKLLCFLLEHTCSPPLSFPLPTVLHTLCRGIAERKIDMYTPEVQGITLNADSAVPVHATAERESLSALVVLVETLNRGAVLPYAQVVARALQRRLSHALLRVRSRDGAIASISERHWLYDGISRVAAVLGSGFTEHIVHIFAELLERDVELYIQGKQTEQVITSRATSHISEPTRSRKRRRGFHPSSRESARQEASHDARSRDELVQAWGPEVLQAVVDVVSSGVKAATVMFENRGILSSPAMGSLERLENLLEQILMKCATSIDTLEAVRAAAIGGGSCRLRGEASRLLLHCLSLSRNLIVSPSCASAMCPAAFRVRSSCELMLHPRGPPVLRTHPRRSEQRQNENSRFQEQTPLVENGDDFMVEADDETGPVDIKETSSLREEMARDDGTEVPSARGANPPRTGRRENQSEGVPTANVDILQDENAPMSKRSRLELKNGGQHEEQSNVIPQLNDAEVSGNSEGNVPAGPLSSIPVSSRIKTDKDVEAPDGKESVSRAMDELVKKDDDSANRTQPPEFEAEGNNRTASESEARGLNTTKQGETGSTFEEDEDVLIASLRFEQSDEE